MKKSLLLISLIFGLSLGQMALAQKDVKGYTRSDGTQVEGYKRTAPNSTRNDNYSTRGNTNPHTGKSGTKPGGTNYGSSNKSRNR